MKRGFVLLCTLGLSALIVFLLNGNSFQSQSHVLAEVTRQESSLLPQQSLRVLDEPIEVTKIYEKGKLIGILHDASKVEEMLEEVYREQYADTFTESELALGEDIVSVQEFSYVEVENIDDDIVNYLKQNNLFSLLVHAVEFSNEEGIYAIIYVDSLEDYEAAMNTYLSYFIDSASLKLLQSGQIPDSPRTYGSRDMSLEILQTITTRSAYASADKVMGSQEEILEYLCYGDNPTREYYVTEPYDTIAGVGSKNNDLTPEQIVAINPGVLTSTEQTLSPGMELNVRYFDSPIDVVVHRESLYRDTVYPDSPLYLENDTIREGNQIISQEEQTGSRNVLMDEVWVNGVLTEGQEISSMVTQQPTQAIIYIGTLKVPGIGSGSFRFPVDNPKISCGWGCYYGHRAIDVQNMYDRWSNVLAADSGTVIVNGYDRVSGNYTIIDHNNGYTSYYGHMRSPGFIPVGQNVEKGDVIGDIGMTGKATGPHVHFYVEENGKRLNPCDALLRCS